jgi:hypothetical protein
MLLSLNPIVAPVAAILAGVVALVLALFTREPNVPHDWEHEARELTRRVRFRARHPKLAKVSRLLGLD